MEKYNLLGTKDKDGFIFDSSDDWNEQKVEDLSDNDCENHVKIERNEHNRMLKARVEKNKVDY